MLSAQGSLITCAPYSSLNKKIKDHLWPESTGAAVTGAMDMVLRITSETSGGRILWGPDSDGILCPFRPNFLPSCPLPSPPIPSYPIPPRIRDAPNAYTVLYEML